MGTTERMFDQMGTAKSVAEVHEATSGDRAHFARRIVNLGTETAFAVSAEAGSRSVTPLSKLSSQVVGCRVLIETG